MHATARGSAPRVGGVTMVGYENRSRRRSADAVTGLVASVLLLLGTDGCNPINTYRNWIGISANDPNSQTTPNAKNLAAGEARSDPNLATVPSPPSRALTTAELDKLTQGLIADRTNAKYASEHLQAQFDEGAAPSPPPPPPPPAAAPAGETKAAVASPATTTSAAPAAGLPTAAPAAHGPDSGPSAASPSNNSGASTPATAATPGAKGPRKSGQPVEPGPMESSLQSAQITGLPQGEQSRSPPAMPPELSVPRGANTANTTASGAHLPPPPAPAPMPAAIGSAQFQPAPPPPRLASAAPVRVATTAGPGKPAKPAPPAPTFEKVATIAFQDNQITLTEADHQALDTVILQYRAKPGLVRVVGYAGVASGAAEQLTSYHTALERAQSVGQGLTKVGIPANKIQLEAAPAVDDSGRGRAEILLQQ
jgi:outer membrane protein OmpA-like peptidoglycan-associated protein